MKSFLPLLTVSLMTLIVLQLAITPIMAATTYRWDASGDLGYYNAIVNAIRATKPIDNEAGGTVWTTLLQLLAANYTSSPKLNIPICLLLPTTGQLGSVGADEIRGADIAVTQANKILNGGSFGVNFSDAFRYDSATSPSQTKTGFDILVSAPDNCQVVVGAASSFESRGFISDANSFRVPAISPASTSVELAIPGDYFFRVIGNDLTQAPAISAWIYHQGIRYLSIIAANFAYGIGLGNGVNASFNALGGRVADYSNLLYDLRSVAAQKSTTDLLNTQIGTTLGSYSANKVGVLLISFIPDAQTIFTQAASETNLAKVDWFGTDQIGGDRSFLPPSDGGTGSLAIAQFLSSVNLTGTQPIGPTLGPGGASMANLAYNGTTIPKVGGGTIDLTGTGYFPIYSVRPQPYWDYAYDAAVLAMLAVLKGNAYNGTSISNELGRTGSYCICNITIGATGLDSLSPTGDRAIQHYLYYAYNASTTISRTSQNGLVPLFVALLSGIVLVAAVVVVRRRRV